MNLYKSKTQLKHTDSPQNNSKHYIMNNEIMDIISLNKIIKSTTVNRNNVVTIVM